MQRTMKIGLLLGTRGASTITAFDATNTIAKFTPLVRKLSKEPRVTNKTNEVIARLGERMVSRGLRSLFGLPEQSNNQLNKMAP